MHTPAKWLAPMMLAALLVPAPQTRTTSLAITGATVIDTATGRLLTDTTVVVEGGAITAVDKGLAPPANARIVDGRGKFVIPGMWDMHTHHQGSGEASLSLYVANGVTGTRDMGSDLDFILALRDQTSSGRLLGPRIIAAGPILDDAPANWPFRQRVRSAAEARAAVDELLKRGVDFIKVHDRTTREAYLAIAEETKRRRVPFAGHVPSRVTVLEAIEAGQKSIEHLANFRVFTECSGGPDYQPSLCRPVFERMTRGGVWQTPTLAFMRVLRTIGASAGDAERDHVAYASPSLKKIWADNQRESAAPPEQVRAFAALAQTSLRVVGDLHRAGVGILAGCDGLVPGFCLADELELLVRSGLSPLAALQAATINAVRYLGLERAGGTIERGKAADLVVLDANPLDDIGNVRRIAAVLRNGTLLTRADLDVVLQKARDRFKSGGGAP